MSGFLQAGLGDDSSSGGPDLSFLSGSMLTAFVVGIGILVLFGSGMAGGRPKRTKGSGRRRSSPMDFSDRPAYVAHVARKHKLSRADQQYLMEHEE
jgi:hypothetical protein